MYRLRSLLLLIALSFASPSVAQDWRWAVEYDVLLSSYDIEPEVIRLKAGQPVRLRFVNNSDKSHDFSAPSFFASAKIRKRDGGLVTNGKLTVGPGRTRTIALVPQAGRHKMRGGSFLYRLMGMSGSIIVE